MYPTYRAHMPVRWLRAWACMAWPILSLPHFLLPLEAPTASSWCTVPPSRPTTGSCQSQST
uniref:Uncharacterized protein n=1 Tax=Arundo donax TaxID=35708 RepID=A0A0A9H7L2_ARUDO